MNDSDIKENISEEFYSIENQSGNLLRIRRIETHLYDFHNFKVAENDLSGQRAAAGNKLNKYCKMNSIVISTDDMDYDIPIIRFLKEYGFKIYYTKMLYTKNLEEHQSLYENIFEYKSLEETGRNEFLKIFKDVREEFDKLIEPEILLDDLIRLAGEKYNPKNYKIALLNGKEIGVIMPQIFPDKPEWGGVFHIGIVPDERNKSYGRIIHSKALDILREQGAVKYLGSTNINNKPMIRLFELNDCKEWFKRFFYAAN